MKTKVYLIDGFVLKKEEIDLSEEKWDCFLNAKPNVEISMIVDDSNNLIYLGKILALFDGEKNTSFNSDFRLYDDESKNEKYDSICQVGHRTTECLYELPRKLDLYLGQIPEYYFVTISDL